MSRATRRGIATNEAGQAPEAAAARATGKNKPSTARLRKAGVNVPVRAAGKRMNALAKRRAKLVAKKNKPVKAPRKRRDPMAARRAEAWDNIARRNSLPSGQF
jgi:hypothetical protein